ncbi:hypothetical protein ACWGI8_40085, partial [Streptomyces sp. NPDC054841]
TALPLTGLSTGIGDDGWVLWFFVPINVFMHLTVASVFGGRQLGVFPPAWIVPLFAIGLTTLSGLMLDAGWLSSMNGKPWIRPS